MFARSIETEHSDWGVIHIIFIYLLLVQGDNDNILIPGYIYMFIGREGCYRTAYVT